MILEEDSRKFVGINTHRGLYQYTQMPFGISSASAIFQRDSSGHTKMTYWLPGQLMLSILVTWEMYWRDSRSMALRSKTVNVFCCPSLWSTWGIPLMIRAFTRPLRKWLLFRKYHPPRINIISWIIALLQEIHSQLSYSATLTKPITEI